MASDEERRLHMQAQKRIEQRWFYRHLAIYVVVTSVLLIAYLVLRDPGDPFRAWVLAAAWGGGIIVHFIFVFPIGAERLEARREREIQREMARLRGRS